MSEPTGHGAEPTADTGPVGAEELRADIARTRADLGETVNELSAKLDVKAQAKDRLHEVRGRAAQAADRAKQAAPEPVRHAVDTTTERARPYVKQILLGAGGLAVLALVLRKWRSGAR